MIKRICGLITLIILFAVISDCVTDAHDGASGQRIEFRDGISVRINLPPEFEVIPNPYEENRLSIEYLPQQTFGIQENGDLIGSITLVDRRVDWVVGRDEDQWIKMCQEDPTAVYEGFFLARLNDNWEQGFR